MRDSGTLGENEAVDGVGSGAREAQQLLCEVEQVPHLKVVCAKTNFF